MLSISDASDLAQSAYAPTAIAVLTLIVIGAFLNIRVLFSELFGRFTSTFLQQRTADEAKKEGSTGSKDSILRISLLLFLVLAWPPFFQNLENVSPLNVHYSPQEKFFFGDREKLARVACARASALDPISTATLIDDRGWDIQSENAVSMNAQQTRAFGMISTARSLSVLILICFLASIFSAKLRDYSLMLIVTSFALLAYTSVSGFSSVQNALLTEASGKLALADASLSDEATAQISQKCLEAFLTQLDERKSQRAIWVEASWPNLGALLP